jgi:hypothetical protein
MLKKLPSPSLPLYYKGRLVNRPKERSRGGE